uniref:Uncharacterized protein n=1 Tax=Anguilla anguilla TaxID=7936 RepID=A0A0E9RKL8_ANGAN
MRAVSVSGLNKSFWPLICLNIYSVRCYSSRISS